MVNVFAEGELAKTVPWSVPSVVEGVLSPSKMSNDAPCTLISGAVTGEQLVPVVTPPGATQLEVAPVREKPVNVPLLPLLVASVRVVMPLLFPPPIPWLNL